MNTRTIVAAVVGAIVMFVLGFLIYGMALDAFLKANLIEYPGLIKDQPNFIALGLYNLVFGWFMAYLFDHWAGIRNFVGGMIGGAVIMFTIGLATNLGFLAFMNIFKELGPIAVDLAGGTAMGAITGGVIGEILGRMGDDVAEA